MKQHHLVIVTLVCLLALAAPPAFAASPLPTFDEEAVRTYPPYMRTGKSDIEIEQKEVKTHEEYREGNTGTEEDPAFLKASCAPSSKNTAGAASRSASSPRSPTK